MITLEQAKRLAVGTTLYHLRNTNADGTAQKWRVTGKPKTWKREPERVKVPVKHGLWDYDYVTEKDLQLVALVEPKPEDLP